MKQKSVSLRSCSGKHRIFLTLAALLLCLSSCGAEEKTFSVGFDGRRLSREEIEALASVEVAAHTETEEEKILIAFAGYVPVEERVYFTASGTVYHLNRNCPKLSGKTTLYYGSMEDAEKKGLDRLCSACEKEKAAEHTATESMEE